MDGHDDTPARLGQVTQRRHHRLRLLNHNRLKHVVRVMYVQKCYKAATGNGQLGLRLQESLKSRLTVPRLPCH